VTDNETFLDELRRLFGNQEATIQRWMELLKPPDGQWTELIVLSAAGVAERSQPRAFESVCALNFGAGAGTLTVAQGPAAAGGAPAAGPGLMQIPAGDWGLFPLRGRHLTLYGGANAVVGLILMSVPVPPAFGKL